MPTQQSSWKHHKMEVSYVQCVWCIITVCWKFRLIHRFHCLKCCWSSSSQVFDACSADVHCPVWSGYTNSMICSICCTEHQPLCIVWLRELVDRGSETASVVFLVKTSITFSTLTSCSYSCSVLVIVSFSNLLLLQHTHTTAKLILLLLGIV